MPILYSEPTGAAKLAWHIAFWVAIFLCFTYIDSGYDHRYYRAALSQLVQMPVKIAFTYSIIYYLFPAYLYKRRYSVFFSLLVLLILLAGTIYRFTQGFVTLPYLYPELPFTPFDPSRFLWAVFAISFPAVIAISITLFISRYESARVEQKLQNENLVAELRFLKAQISPHFLFNTLNNIYGLSLSGSPQTPEAILKLSGLLRFVLQNAASGYISLEEELEILDDYIALEQLRYGGRLDLRFVREIDSPGRMIAPLILLSLVENSFKRGASESLSNPYIHITLNVKDGMLHFKIANSKEPRSRQHEEGIGLNNIHRQLELTYGPLYSFDIRDEELFYCLTLTINLQAHEKAKLHDH